MSAELKPLACPFCGHVGLDFSEGSTFRWIVASCGGCGATRGETRIQTLGQGTKEEWMAEAQADAIAEWNRRATPAPGAPAEPTEAMVLAMVRRMFSERNYAAPWEDVMRLAYMDAIAAAPGAPGQEAAAVRKDSLTTQAAAVQAMAQETDRDWSKAQDWKGMDGATAFLLINRHSDGWGDVGAMMNAWLAANAATPAAVQAVGAWQDIATAPKGQNVLLYRGAIGRIDIDDWGLYDAYNQPRFTHWMPLPPPPSGAGEKTS